MFGSRRRWTRFGLDQSGFTLVETLAALIVFTLVTLGVLPLLASSLRGATVARSYTVGRNLAQQAMERVRGLPYHIAFNTRAKKVDVLDLYYPTAQSTGVSTIVCTSASVAELACPRNIITDYTVTFRSEFVNAADASTVLRAGTDYTNAYAWNSSSDAPPSQLLRITITATWSVGGVARNFALQSLISDRKFGELKFSGTATVDYLVRTTGSFFDTTGNQGDLIAQLGGSESTIESKLQSSAVQTVSAGALNLLDTSGAELATPVAGAQKTIRVPPQTNVLDPGTTTSASAGEVSHGGVPVARMEPTQATGVKAGVAAELPYAGGTFVYALDSTVTDPPRSDFWAGGQPPLLQSLLGLESGGHMVEVFERSSNGTTIAAADSLFGGTTATSTSLASATPGTESTAAASLKEVRFFALDAARIPVRTYGGAVAVLRNFTSNVRCLSTGTAGAMVQATWTATMTYWQDPEDDVSGNGSYVDVATLSGAAGTDPLAAIKAANPLVWEAPTDDPLQQDVYLFEDPTATPAKPGYLVDWSTASTVSTAGVQKHPSGDETSAKISGAVSVRTATPDPRVSTGLFVQVGSLSCRSVDFRV